MIAPRFGPNAGDACHPLSAGAHPPAVAFARDVAQALTSTYGKQPDNSDTAMGPNLVAFNWQAAGNQTTLGASSDSAATLSKSTTQAVAFQSSQSGVRRLTPRECERLQGWPDDHTRWRLNVKRVGNTWQIVSRSLVAQADGPRYRQCGNGITRNVAEWIAQRIVRFAAVAVEGDAT